MTSKRGRRHQRLPNAPSQYATGIRRLMSRRVEESEPLFPRLFDSAVFRLIFSLALSYPHDGKAGSSPARLTNAFASRFTFYPFRLRRYGRFGRGAGIAPAHRRDPHQRLDGHAGFDDDLAGKPDLAEQAAVVEFVVFGARHRPRFAVDETNAAGGAARVSTAAMPDVYAAVFDGKHEPLAFGGLTGTDTFNGDRWHSSI